jgi:hypothetical protein
MDRQDDTGLNRRLPLPAAPGFAPETRFVLEKATALRINKA